MPRIYERKPLAERNVCSITIPLTQEARQRLENRAKRTGVHKTVIARDMILAGLDQIDEPERQAPAA